MAKGRNESKTRTFKRSRIGVYNKEFRKLSLRKFQLVGMLFTATKNIQKYFLWFHEVW